MTVRKSIEAVTERIRERSKQSREIYLERVNQTAAKGVNRAGMGCSNLAHGFAACSMADKTKLADNATPNIGIITAYNDMLSAHQPFEHFPDLIRKTATAAGGVAQVAGGVPAMCDGVTQGTSSMELSLFSRDVIAMASAVGLSHNMFDAALFLGICDKIVPGLVMGALTFGHIPSIFIPSGPMPSGMPNDEKAKTRQLFTEGKIGRDELLKAESASYHSPGTCTFYGTANSNQMLMEIMGLHLPGASFVNPNTPLRDALTAEATKRALAITQQGNAFTPIAKVMDEKAIVNGVVGVHATGGSTNQTLHLVAIARAAGIQLTLQDMSDLSDEVPLLARIYPNGLADINHFHAAGGMGLLMRELLNHGYLHEDVTTVWGEGLRSYTKEPGLHNDQLVWRDVPEKSGDDKIITSGDKPFSANGGLKMVSGNIGTAVSKISAVKPERRLVEAPAIVFHDQHEILDAFKAGELEKDFIAVLRFQGPKANGMPELHKMVPPLGVLQDRGFKVALVTDGRMSGASGKIPSAIHVTPEAKDGGPIAKIKTGDMIRLDAEGGKLEVLVDQAEFDARDAVSADLSANEFGMGRELFAGFRQLVGASDAGACVF